jgi:hypothetical protein
MIQTFIILFMIISLMFICLCLLIFYFLLNESSLNYEVLSCWQALDILGSTKWRVNRRVHDVVETIWSRGGGIAGLVDKGNVSQVHMVNQGIVNTLFLSVFHNML